MADENNTPTNEAPDNGGASAISMFSGEEAEIPSPGQAPDSDGSDFSISEFTQDFEPGQNPAQVNPQTPSDENPEDPGKPEEKPNQDTPGVSKSFSELMESILPEKAPDLIKGEKAIENFSEMRKVIKAVSAKVDEKEAIISELEKQIQEGGRIPEKGPDGKPVPQNEELVAAQKELKELKASLPDLQKKAAQAELSGNLAFKQDYDSNIAKSVAEISRIAQQAGLSEDDMKKALDAPGELAAIRNLEEHLDESAMRLVSSHVQEVFKTRDAREAALNGPNVIDVARQYQDYEQSFHGSIMEGFTEGLHGEFAKGFNAEMPNLQASDPFFQTEEGKAIIDDIGKRLIERKELSPGEALVSLAISKKAEIQQATFESQAKELKELKAENQRLRDLSGYQPTKQPGGQQKSGDGSVVEEFAQPSPSSSSGFKLEPFGGQ